MLREDICVCLSPTLTPVLLYSTFMLNLAHWRIQWGGGGCGGCNPPFFPKHIGHLRGRCDRFTGVAVVIELVAASSNNACLCALNSVAV